VLARQSPFSLYRTKLASFSMTGYNPRDAEGFINLFALPITVPEFSIPATAADGEPVASRSATR